MASGPPGWLSTPFGARRAWRWSPQQPWRRCRPRPRRRPREPLRRGAPLAMPTARRWRRPGASCARMAACRCAGGVAGAGARPPPSSAATCRSATGTPGFPAAVRRQAPCPEGTVGARPVLERRRALLAEMRRFPARPGPETLDFPPSGAHMRRNLERRPFAGRAGRRSWRGCCLGRRSAAASRRRNRPTLSDTSDRPAASAAEDDHTNTPPRGESGRTPRRTAAAAPPPPEAEAAAEPAADADDDR